MNKFVLNSEVCPDLSPAAISSAAANVTDTPEALKLAGADVFEASNLRLKMSADVTLDASGTVTVKVRARKTDRDGTTTTLGDMDVAISAGTRGQAEKNIDVSGLAHDDTLFFQTETTVTGTASYEAICKFHFIVPLSLER